MLHNFATDREWADHLYAAIAEHHRQKADDRCREDDDRLYAAAGLPPADVRIGDPLAMVVNCVRFIKNRCEGGGWPSYVDLEAKLAAAEAKLAGAESDKLVAVREAKADVLALLLREVERYGREAGSVRSGREVVGLDDVKTVARSLLMIAAELNKVDEAKLQRQQVALPPATPPR